MFAYMGRLPRCYGKNAMTDKQAETAPHRDAEELIFYRCGYSFFLLLLSSSLISTPNL